MRKHVPASLLLSLTCLLLVVFAPAHDANASSYDPFISGTDMTLDVTDPIRDAAMLLVDPTDLAKLALTTARCSQPGSPALYGMTVGTMYCIQQYISNATHIYAAGLNNTNNKSVFGITLNFFVTLYQGTCMLLAVALFGVRMMAMQMEHPVTEVFKFITKVGLAFYLITQAPTLYDTMVAGIGEGIGWITNLLGVVVTPAACWPIDPLKTALTTVDSTVDYTQYQVWHLVDCVFLHIFGAALPDNINIPSLGINIPLPTGANKLVYASALPIVGAALFTSTLGLGAGLIGLGALVGFIEFILKCMFLVLSSYLTISLFCLLTPFFAPLLMFETHRDDGYPMKVFRKWLGILFGAVVQPIVILGYLSFAVVLLDAIIEGDTSSDADIKALFANCGDVDKPGDGLCSFQQIFSPEPPWTLGTAPDVAGVGDYNMNLNINPVYGHIKIAGDPQLASSDCNMVNKTLTYMLQMANDTVNQIEGSSLGTKINGPSGLKATPNRIMRLTITLICFVILAVTLKHLIEVIPLIAEQLGGSTLQNFWKGTTVPFVSSIRAALEGGKDALDADKGKGLFSGGRLADTLDGAVSGMGNFLVGRRK